MKPAFVVLFAVICQFTWGSAANCNPLGQSAHFDRIKTMAVTVDGQNTGDHSARTEVVALIEHALCDREGEWRVSSSSRKRS